MRRFHSHAVAAAALAALAAAGGTAQAHQIILPDGFENRGVLEGLGNPVDLAFLPSGRALVALKHGRIHLIASRVLVSPPILTLPVNGELDRGLQSIVVDPDYPAKPYLYALYTLGGALPVNRVSRFRLTDNPGAAGVTLTNELVLVDGLDSTGKIHSGGGLVVGPDGYLYVATGDGGFGSDLSQDTMALEGKILRLTRRGDPAPGNPFAGTPGYRPEIYCVGLRNPFRMALRPQSSEIFVNDVGYVSWEEINRVAPGANFGWPLEEGPASTFDSPVHAYPHDTGSAAVTGGTFYVGSEFPVEFQRNYFFADYSRGTLNRMVLDDGTGAVASVEEFGSGYEGPVALRVGPDDALYVVSVTSGEIDKIIYVGDANRPPRAKLVAEPTSGIAPISVLFVADDAYDPDADPISYTWRFDDGTSYTTSEPQILRFLGERRIYRVDLTLDDGQGGVTRPNPLLFDANNSPPSVSIEAPVAESSYSAGEEIAISGSASDPEEGPLGANALSWKIVFHHDTHTHPYLGPISGVASGSFSIPTRGEGATNTAYEILLTATDSRGSSHTESVMIRPRLVDVTLVTDPPGCFMRLDGTPVQTPYTFTGVVGFERELSGLSPHPPRGDELTWFFLGVAGYNGPRVRISLPPAPTTFTGRYGSVHRY